MVVIHRVVASANSTIILTTCPGLTCKISPIKIIRISMPKTPTTTQEWLNIIISSKDSSSQGLSSRIIIKTTREIRRGAPTRTKMKHRRTKIHCTFSTRRPKTTITQHRTNSNTHSSFKIRNSNSLLKVVPTCSNNSTSWSKIVRISTLKSSSLGGTMKVVTCMGHLSNKLRNKDNQISSTTTVSSNPRSLIKVSKIKIHTNNPILKSQKTAFRYHSGNKSSSKECHRI